MAPLTITSPGLATSALLLALGAFIAACSNDNFSQSPGFEAIRQALPSEPPTLAEQQLLERHKPLLYISPGAEGPIDFYRDYVADGRLYGGRSQAVERAPRSPPAECRKTRQPSAIRASAPRLGSSANAGRLWRHLPRNVSAAQPGADGADVFILPFRVSLLWPPGRPPGVL